MRFTQNILIAVLFGVLAAGIAFWRQAGADEATGETTPIMSQQADAVFAGGCFWCVESDFDKLDGVLETISGYTGGDLPNPTYKQVSYENTGHYEAVRVIYDPEVISYDELVDYFWRHIDPTDPDGQFCDKGDSYKSAIFVGGEEQRKTAEDTKTEIEKSEVLPGPVVTKILDRDTFWPAEDYHQNYYKTHPIKYRYYRSACGRDKRVKQVWQSAEAH